MELFSQAEEKEKVLRELETKRERLFEWKKEAVAAADTREAECEAKNAEVIRLREQAEELRRTWESYAIYDTEGEAAHVSMDIAELAVQIDGNFFRSGRPETE